MCIDRDLSVGGQTALGKLRRDDENRTVGGTRESMVSGVPAMRDGLVPGEQESSGDLLSARR